jgi:hypothetical protein
LLAFKNMTPVHIRSAGFISVEDQKLRTELQREVDRLFIFKLQPNSLDGVYINMPYGQDYTLAEQVLEYLRKAGFEIGAYSLEDDRCLIALFPSERLEQYACDHTEVYEIVARSRDAITSALKFLKVALSSEKVRQT